MVRSTFLGASQPPRTSEVKKNDFGSYNGLTPPMSKGVTNHPLVVTPGSPPRKERDEGLATVESTSTADTSSTNERNNHHPHPLHNTGSADLSDISTNDKLSVLRDGPEATIVKLRTMLDESSQRDATAKAALAKSDAVILELRSSVRQLKREVERLQNENDELQQPSHESVLLEQVEERHKSEVKSLKSQLTESTNGNQSREEFVGELQVQLDRAHAQMLTADMVRKELEDTLEAEQYTWELRVQDQDRTIASLQQECQTLRQDLSQCRSQWSEAEEGWSTQLKDLQNQLEATKRELNNAHHPSEDVKQLKQSVTTLEQDRTELQSCLDEAMQELEAVDAEIQAAQVWQSERDELMEENRRLQSILGGDSNAVSASSVKHLKSLVKWIKERPTEFPFPQSKAPELNEDDPDSMVAFVKDHVEALHVQLSSAEVGSNLAEAREKVEALEGQLSVFRGDLKAREESSTELRTSLKEAVALLKPLQEVVDKTEREKEELNQELERLQNKLEEGSQHQELKQELQDTKTQVEVKEAEVKRLKGEVTALEKQLDESRKKVAAAAVGKGIGTIAARSVQPSNEQGAEEQRQIETNVKLEKAREEIRAKRANERALKQMLKNAQSTFSKINQQNRDVANENQLLQEKLSETEKRLNEKSFDTSMTPVTENSLATIERLEDEIKNYSEQLTQKEGELARVSSELQKVRDDAEVKETEKRWEHAHRVEDLEAELSKTKGDLKNRKEAERVLGSSLKEALRLLHPLQEHLETAEREKKKLSRELKAANRRAARLENGEDAASRTDTSTNISRSLHLPPDVQGADMERLVQELEEENSRLQDALEEISLNLSLSADEVAQLDSQSPSMLKENFVELKSRYEVTRQRLENACAQRSNLAEKLEEKVEEEKLMMEEMKTLREKLHKSNEELENAKYIATSALVKVEEMTMAAVEKEMVDLSAEASPIGLAVVEKEIMDMSRKNATQGNGEKMPAVEEIMTEAPLKSEDVRNLRLKVESLEREVRHTQRANVALEQSVRERDRSLKRITEQRHRARASHQPSRSEWLDRTEQAWGYLPDDMHARRQLT